MSSPILSRVLNLPSSLLLVALLVSLIDCSRATRLLVWNTSPAVLDSNITFTAQLDEQGTIEVADNVTLYIYEWTDDAVILHLPIDTLRTEGPAAVKISKLFPMYPAFIRPGTFKMMVTVYEKPKNKTEKRKKIAEESSHFILTEHLNVNMKLVQHLSVTAPPGVYATGQNLMIKAVTTDVFSQVKYNYTWHIHNGSEPKTTLSPKYMGFFFVPGHQAIRLTVKAQVNVSTLRGTQVFSKTGQVKENIILKDPITELVFQGQTFYHRVSTLNGTLTCQGSPPFELCVNITSPDGEHVMECLTPTSNSSCTFPLQYHLRHWGNYTLDVVARNDVSKVRHKFVVKVTQSVVPVSPFVAIACVSIAVGVAVMLAYTYSLDRRRMSDNGNETADFDFHVVPMVRNWNRNSTLEKLRGSAGAMAESVRRAYDRRTLPCNRPTVYSDSNLNSPPHQQVLIEL